MIPSNFNHNNDYILLIAEMYFSLNGLIEFLIYVSTSHHLRLSAAVVLKLFIFVLLIKSASETVCAFLVVI